MIVDIMAVHLPYPYQSTHLAMSIRLNNNTG